jgi:small basic protein
MKSLIKMPNDIESLRIFWKSLVNFDRTLIVESFIYLVISIISLIFLSSYVVVDVLSIICIVFSTSVFYSYFLKNKKNHSVFETKLLNFILITEKKSDARRGFED